MEGGRGEWMYEWTEEEEEEEDEEGLLSACQGKRTHSQTQGLV